MQDSQGHEYISQRKAGGRTAVVKPGPRAQLLAKSVSGEGIALHLKAEDIDSSEEWGSVPAAEGIPSCGSGIAGRAPAFKLMDQMTASRLIIGRIWP